MKIEKFMDSAASTFTLSNENGMEVVLTNIGATIVRIWVPDKNGKKVDVACGYDTPDRYLHNKSWFGAIVGRFANRIKNATAPIDGVLYQLDANEGKNVLHGGPNGYISRIWYAKADQENNKVTFFLNSPHMDQGMPGNLDIEVTYSLDKENRLEISFHAVADQKTYINLTNHSYFNLDGHNAGPIDDQLLWMDCDQFVPIDAEFIPEGPLMEVKGTAFDFTTMKPIGRDAAADEDQIRKGNGYDHNWVLNDPSLEKPFAIVESLKTGIVMKCFTDLPGVQFYGGNNMGADFGEKDGSKYEIHGAFCMETQYFPDTPNRPDFPSCLFEAGEAFDSRTVYQFETKK